jgi:hypothetical protein
MNKIPTVYMRDENDRRYVTPVVDPRCEWVLAGEGVATRKYDGTCCRLDGDGTWWARREVKPGKVPPPNYLPIETDNTTGKTVGWEPIGQSAFAKYHAGAVRLLMLADSTGLLERDDLWTPGTFELVGPKINGNPEKLAEHMLIRHSHAEVLAFTDRSFAEMHRVLLFLNEKYGYEGVVFHHPDGRAAKLKARDFPRSQT